MNQKLPDFITTIIVRTKANTSLELKSAMEITFDEYLSANLDIISYLREKNERIIAHRLLKGIAYDIRGDYW